VNVELRSGGTLWKGMAQIQDDTVEFVKVAEYR